MKSYQQYCSVARALDVAGDRWVLLIVRELLAFGPSRYSDLKRGLPGIATNLLAERLKTMEADGLIERFDAPAPVATHVYQLTPRGRELEDVLRALTRWGLSSMPAGPTDADAVQPQWSALLAALTIPGEMPAGTEITVGIDTDEAPGEAVHAVLRHDGFEIHRGAAADSDVTLSGPAQLVGGVLSGLLTPTRASRHGLTIRGNRSALAGLLSTSRTRAGATT